MAGFGLKRFFSRASSGDQMWFRDCRRNDFIVMDVEVGLFCEMHNVEWMMDGRVRPTPLISNFNNSTFDITYL